MRVGCGGSTTETRFLRGTTGLPADRDTGEGALLRTAWRMGRSSLKIATRSLSEVSCMRSDVTSEGEGTAVSGTDGRIE